MRCLTCNEPVKTASTVVDAQRAVRVHYTGCGHEMSQAEAEHLWQAGVRWHMPRVDGAALIQAERARQVEVEGYTPDHDVEHDDGDLPWAAFCYLDVAASQDTPPTEPPQMWPWSASDWKPDKTPLRLLIIAGALIAAAIDRRLANGERP